MKAGSPVDSRPVSGWTEDPLAVAKVTVPTRRPAAPSKVSLASVVVALRPALAGVTAPAGYG